MKNDFEPLTKLSIEEIKNGLSKKDFSAQELLLSYKKNFDKYEKLNVSITDCWEDSLKAAQEADRRINSTEERALEGIPISIKDMFLTKGIRTTAASKILENFIAPYESFVTQKLKDSGYLMPFKANQDEFAMGSSNEYSAFGPTINPWIMDDFVPRVPGGSSGGSAAAVASYMCAASLGTDTGGSIRQPAAFCGIVGFKPTYGRCSRRGVIAFASSLDHPSIFARSVQDAAIVFENIAGHDPKEATSLNREIPLISKAPSSVNGMKIGIIPDIYESLPEEYCVKIKNMICELQKNGASVEEIKMPPLEQALEIYYVIAPAEAASNLSRYDGIRFGVRGEGSNFEEIVKNTRNLFGKEVKRRILIGTYVLSAGEYKKFYGKAIVLREAFKQEMAKIFSRVDVILLPTTPNVAFPINSNRCPIEMYNEDLYTIPANIYGGPSIQVPIGKISAKREGVSNKEFDFLKADEKLPIGVQVMGPIEGEAMIISAAKKIEEIACWEGL